MCKNSKKESRLLWADYVKALAIILMVLCHANIGSEMGHDFIYTFHMPLFFIMSGYFDKEYAFSFVYIKTLFRSLIVPYFFFSVLGFSICWIAPVIHPEFHPYYQSFPSIFISAARGMFMMTDIITSYSVMPYGPLWFLIALFWNKLCFSLIVRYRNVFVLVILCVFFLFICSLDRINLFSYKSSIYSLPFYVIGYCLNKHKVLSIDVPYPLLALISFVLAWYIIQIGVSNGNVDLYRCICGDNLLLFYVNGVIGSLMCISLCKLFVCVFGEMKYMSAIGQSTMVILGTHLYFVIIGKVIYILLFNDSNSDYHLYFAIFVTIVSCFCAVQLRRFFIRFCPFLIGVVKK